MIIKVANHLSKGANLNQSAEEISISGNSFCKNIILYKLYLHLMQHTILNTVINTEQNADH